LLEKYASGGAILDLGCGIGYLGEFIDDSRFSVYVGVDISDKAIEDAKRKKESPNLRYVTGDIETYVPEGWFNVIAFKDSIYYVPFHQLTRVLDRSGGYLSDTGVLIGYESFEELEVRRKGVQE
jgi:2-polyprenyl-3-methyl-5-hydroxy-6-metoxy-1,4-benzoquinol methylase